MHAARGSTSLRPAEVNVHDIRAQRSAKRADNCRGSRIRVIAWCRVRYVGGWWIANIANSHVLTQVERSERGQARSVTVSRGASDSAKLCCGPQDSGTRVGDFRANEIYLAEDLPSWL